jgi:membrane-anchored mycosin MYCP
MTDPNLPVQAAWRTVRTVASPAWFTDYVLTVAALSPYGEPSDFSLHGPWIQVAAPGEQAVSLNPAGAGLTNAIVGQQGLAPLNGTSYAAPYVAGLAALVRARFPQLTAAQVMDRIKLTAHTPGPGPNIATGYGLIDPVAALSSSLPADPLVPRVEAPIAGPPLPDAVSTRARTISFTVAGGCVATMVFAWAVYVAYRRR